MLAVIASVTMVVAKNSISIAGTIAVIAALWAAVLGAVLMTKYRRQAEVAEARNRDQRMVYEVQLEREISARRQYEAEVETAVRSEIAEETNAEFEALKTQVLALRASLEKVLGNPLPEVPLALRPERRRELGSGLSGVTYARSADDRVAADLDFASTAPPADAGRHAPEAAVDEAHAAVELTEIIPVVTEEESVEYDGAEYPAGDGQAGEYPAAEYPAAQYEAAEYEDAEYDEHDYSQTAQYTEQPQYAEQQYTEQPRYGQPQYAQQPQYSQPQYAQQQYGQTEYASQQQYQAPEYSVTGYVPGGYDSAGYQPPSTGEAAVPPIPPMPQMPAVPPIPQRAPRRAVVDDGAHTGGQPVSELLNRLRESSGPSAGGRRRRD